MNLIAVKENSNRAYCRSIDQICQYVKESIRQNKSNRVTPLHAICETAVLQFH